MSHGFTRNAKSVASISNGSFGAKQTKENMTVYLAEEDGYVVAWGYSYSVAILIGTTPSPSFMVCTYHYTGGTGSGSTCTPVKKGYYWQAQSFTNVMWVPLSYA